MASPVDTLKAAGFSDDEVGAWSEGQRTTLSAAGFGDDEIDAYLGGPKKAPPAAFLDRMIRGEHITRVLGEIGASAKEGWGTPEAFSPAFEQQARDLGLFNDPAKGQASPIRTFNEALARPIGAGIAVLGAATNAGVHALGTIVGGVAGDLGLDPDKKAKTETINFLNFLMADAGGRGGMPMSRPYRTPLGAVHDQPIGGLPEAGEYGDAAHVTIGGPAPPYAADKMERLWDQHGIHPAEVAHDAQSDVTIAQDLASSAGELPRAYVENGRLPGIERPVEAARAPEAIPAPETGATGEPPTARPALATEAPAELRSFSPADLKIDAARFQFKEGGDLAGVTDRLQGVTQWDPIKSGVGIVFEDLDGVPYVVDGHQRVALAQRIAEADSTQAPRFYAHVLRAAEGVTDADARAVAAAKNIAEGTGTALDAAKVLRDRPDLADSLPPRSELVRQAQGLANLAPEPFGMVVNDVVPANYAAIVGRLVPQDAKLQGALVNLLAKAEPANAVQAESIVRQGIDAGLHVETQATLFGDQELVSSLYAGRARILDRALKTLRRDRTVFQSIADNRAIIEELGNRLAQDENLARAAADAQAVQILQTLANRRGPLGDALTGAARSVADGSSDAAAATRDFVAEIRRQAQGGDLARLADGGTGSPLATPGPGPAVPAAARDAAQTRGAEGGVAKPPAEPVIAAAPADEAAASARVQAVVKSETTPQGEQLVIPGAEPSAIQAAAAREAEGHGRMTSPTAQQEPGGLFAEKPAETPDLFENPEAGALRIGRPGPTLTPAQEAIRETIDFDARRERRWSFSRLYTAVLDKLHPVEEAVTAVGGEALPASQHPYKLMRLLAGGPGKAEGWLKYGQRDFTTGDKIGPSLREILSPVEGDLEQFDIFAQSVRALELDRRGIESGKPIAAARQVAAEGVDRYGPVLAHLIQYQDNLARYLRDSGVLSAEGYEAMREANRLYVPFYRVFGDEELGGIGGGGSLQPKNPIQRIKGSERQTVPALESIMRNTFLYLTMAERNLAGTTLVDLLRAERDAHGRIRDVSAEAPRDSRATPPRIPEAPPAPARPPETPVPRADLFPERGPVPEEVTSPVRPVPPTTEASVAEAIRDLLADHRLSGSLFDFVASSVPPAEGEIRIFRNGRAETWQVGRDVAEAVKALDQDSVNLITKLLNPLARSLRAGATLTPDFALRNIIRDFLTAFVNTSTGVFSPLRSVRGLTSAITRDEHFQNWLDAGGGNASLVSMDRRYLQEGLRDLNASTGLMERGWNVVRHPIDTLRLLSELSEQMTRVGEFRAQEARNLAAGMTAKEAAQEAAFASREVTIDFSRIGSQMRSLNMSIAFFNPTLQGTDRLARAFKADPIGTSVKVAAGVTIPSILLWLYNHDDPDYQELPGWQRDLFWILPVGTAEPSPLHIKQAEERGEPPKPSARFFFRIPKPFELGVLFGSGAERLLDAFVAERPDASANFVKSLWGAITPSIVPTAILPFWEQYANRSFFTDRNLIPKSLEGQLPEYQYQPYTTETAKKLGSIIAAFPGVRDTSLGQSPAAGVAAALSTPILMENYLRSWTGGLGAYALQAVDLGLRKAGVVPDPPKPADTLADLPVIKAFAVRYPSASAESIQRFYDDFEKNKRYFDSWMAKAQEGDVTALERIQEAGGMRLFVQFDGIKEALGEHSKLIRDITKSPDILPEEKRQLIDQLYFSEIQIAQAGRQALRAVDQALAPSATVH